MKTFERVIAEQQAEIDGMKTVIESQLKQMNGVFTKHYDLFQAFGELIDAKLPDRTNEEALKRYIDAALEVPSNNGRGRFLLRVQTIFLRVRSWMTF